MANIELATASQKKVWTAKRYDEYVRGSGFKPFMGKSPNKIIHVRYDLKSDRGDTVNIPLFAKLHGKPKRGEEAIEGNEKGLANFNFPISIDWVGDGVAVSNSDQFRTEIDLLDAGRLGLTNFMGEVLRDDIIAALNSKNGAYFQDANAAALNAWVVANRDRVLFGEKTDNFNANFNMALQMIGEADGKLAPKIVQLARFLARNSQPIIRPAVVEERAGMSGEKGNIIESYVMFVGGRSFYYLKNDPLLREDLRHAMDRGVKNPLFQPDDLMIDNVVVREIPEITEQCVMSGAGASGVDLEPYFFCGAQAIGYAVGQDPKFTTDARDYGHVNGVAVRELRGISKTLFSGRDHGMVSGYVAAPKI